MGRFITYAKLLLAVTLAVVIFLNQSVNAGAVSEKVWVDTPIVKAGETTGGILSSDASHCSNDLLPISVIGWIDTRDACVYGREGGTQIARYTNLSGLYLYAVKFPHEAKYYPIKDLCFNRSGCVYSQSEDTFLIQTPAQFGLATAIVTNFTHYLVKHVDDGVYYRFEYLNSLPYITLGSNMAHTNSVAMSSNGEWALVEINSYGFIRINIKTREYKRVVAPGAQYGYGSDPLYELAITDDGTKIAIAGWRAGMSIYEVDDECGDILTDTSSLTFSPYIYTCRSAAMDIYQLFPGFTDAYAPRFSRDGTKLTVLVQSGQLIKKATITPKAFLTSTSSRRGYVAFGDSFTSGEGELSDAYYVVGTNTEQNHCHVSTRSYPYLLGLIWNEPTANKACSGSRIADVQEASSRMVLQSNIETPGYISIGVGGNDIDLMGKLKTCLGIGTCEWALPEKRQASQEEIAAALPQLINLVGEVKRDFPLANITLVGYPSVINATSAATCTPLVAGLLSVEERQYMDESVRYLNTVIKTAAHYTHVPYVDVEDALVGERLCDTSESAMNALRLGGDIAPLVFLNTLKIIGSESFHPTPRGHQLIAIAIEKGMGAWWGNDNCGECQASSTLPPPSLYWKTSMNGGIATVQRSETFLSTASIKNEDTVPFSFPVGSFAPGSTVTFELHSTPKELAKYSVEADGSLSGSLTIASVSGYHTVHALGRSLSGDAIDTYETIAIASPVENVVGVATPIKQSAKTNTPSIPMLNEVQAGDTFESAPLSNIAFSAPLLRNMPSTSSTTYRSVTVPIFLAALAVGGVLIVVMAIIYIERKIRHDR